MKIIAVIFPIGLALLLAACGGGGGGGDTGAFRFLSVQATPGGDGDPKRLRIEWTVRGQADGYRLEFNSDGSSGFVRLDAPLGFGDFTRHPLHYMELLEMPIAGDASSVELEVALHLLQWQRARFQLVALDAQGEVLARSEEIPLAQVPVAPMIGQLQASNRRPEDAELPGGDRFGRSIALSDSGDLLAVGKPSDQSGGSDPADTSAPAAGAVFIYQRGEDGRQAHYLKSNSPTAGVRFGEVLALSGDGRWLAVGAPGETYTEESNFGGAVYLFERSDDDWIQRSRIALDAADFPTAHFPHNLALSRDGSVLAAGSVFYGAFVYRLENGAVVESQVIPRTGEDEHRAFAQSLALSADGSVLAIGAMGMPVYSDPGYSVDYFETGVVHLYRRGQGQWQKSSAIEGSFGFASALALSAGGYLLAVADINDGHIGSGVNPPRDAAAFSVSGAVYIYRESGEDWQEEAFIKATNNPGSFHFGTSLDLSGSGYRLVVGAPKESSAAAGVFADPAADDSMADAGAAYIYLRENGNWRAGNYIKSPEPACGKYFGSGAAISADGRTLALAAVPEQEPIVNPEPGGVAVGIADENCPGQSAEDYPLNGAVYLY